MHGQIMFDSWAKLAKVKGFLGQKETPMQDDWAMYCEELNKIQVNPTQIFTPHINGATHQKRHILSTIKIMFAAVNDRIEEMEERLAKERDVIPGMITTGTVTLVRA